MIDLVVVGRRLYLGHMIIQHMIVNYRKTGRILPYGPLLTKVFEAFGIDLNIEPDAERPRSTNIINTIALVRMRIFKDKNGRWVPGRDDHEDYDEDDSDEGDEGEKNMNGGGDHNQHGINEALNVP